MHFAHHNRQERREQQRDVSCVCTLYLYLNPMYCGEYELSYPVIKCCSVLLLLWTGRTGSVCSADAHLNPHHCIRSEPDDGHPASLQP